MTLRHIAVAAALSAVAILPVAGAAQAAPQTARTPASAALSCGYGEKCKDKDHREHGRYDNNGRHDNHGGYGHDGRDDHDGRYGHHGGGLLGLLFGVL
ncbi:hypothetical protein [Streptomyces melanogenes]|uniref:Uncharacterized protein n=1 Tax=Streptomyces melanogenes TaxID=67326 RepID=A0ABZ1XZF7_9ACTN|nr:hypothetical protein [Streptomyces melanogenes]